MILILITCGCNIGIWKKFQTGTCAASHQKKPRLTKQTLNTDFINCIWPYFTRLAAASFVKLTKVCLVFPCTKTILSCGKPFQLLQLLFQSNSYLVKIKSRNRCTKGVCTRTPYFIEYDHERNSSTNKL